MKTTWLVNLSVSISAWLIAVAVWLFGPLTALFWTAVFMSGLDIVTGTLAALMSDQQQFDSKIFKKGLLKKIGMIVAITAIYRIDALAPELSAIFPGFQEWQAPIRDVCLGAFIFNDLMSNLENLGKWGVPIPQVIVDRLAQLKLKNSGAD